MIHSDFSEVLLQHGLKNTINRQEILRVLMESPQPLTADQIYIHLNKSGRIMNLSTIYRTLSALSEKKLLNKVILTNESKTLYEFDRRIHKHYFICQDCKKIIPIEHCPLVDYEKKLTLEMGFEVTGHKLSIYGYCRLCSEKRALRNNQE